MSVQRVKGNQIGQRELPAPAADSTPVKEGGQSKVLRESLRLIQTWQGEP